MMPMWRMVSIALHDGYHDDDRDDGFVDRCETPSTPPESVDLFSVM